MKKKLERKIQLFLCKCTDEDLEEILKEASFQDYAKKEKEFRKKKDQPKGKILSNMEEISREADLLPKWQRDLSGFSSNYPSELQPHKEERDSKGDPLY